VSSLYAAVVGEEEPMTRLDRKTEGCAGFPPLRVMSELSWSRDERVMKSMGLSFERRMGRSGREDGRVEMMSFSMRRFLVT
jgi:hypothetical protein